ncbi:hypothetical protein HY623_03940 [Candidatus Uhrbacteria bacterium]|nr:hypothetical protein [Candidatus Uhrbacteria bacterium]
MIKTCKQSNKQFEISEREQELRKKLGVPLPVVHPYERMKELMTYRNVMSLYYRVCDLCKKEKLSLYDKDASFPVYCRDCWYSDTWEAKSYHWSLDRPFFEQIQELWYQTPHLGLCVALPLENSEYNNCCSSLKNCYMCFDVATLENCSYVLTADASRDCIACVFLNSSELCFEGVFVLNCYKVWYSFAATGCNNSMFLYDCSGCSNCFMSDTLSAQSYVFRNESVSKEEYERRMNAIDWGSHAVVGALKAEYRQMVQKENKNKMIGSKNERVSGNFIRNSHDVEGSFAIIDSENCINSYALLQAKDSLDNCTYGLGSQLTYLSTTTGFNSYNIRYCVDIVTGTNLEYSCWMVNNCTDCFACYGLKKKQYCIFNNQYTKEEYETLKGELIAAMHKRGEYGKFFPIALCPWGYNETLAQLNMPLSKEEALSQGFGWKEKIEPTYDTEQVYQPRDHIKDIAWGDVKGKLLVCEQSGRPFKLIKQEFDFYKKYAIPLPRLHPEIRLTRLYPGEYMYGRTVEKEGVSKGLL